MATSNRNSGCVVDTTPFRSVWTDVIPLPLLRYKVE